VVTATLSQLGLSVFAVFICLVLVIMTFHEVDQGRRFHKQSRIAAKLLKEDEAELIPLLYKRGVEREHTVEEGHEYTVVGAPIDHWLNGDAGTLQKLAASYDVDPGSKPQPLVHLPDHYVTSQLTDPERRVWGSLDFQAAEERKVRIAAPRKAKAPVGGVSVHDTSDVVRYGRFWHHRQKRSCRSRTNMQARCRYTRSPVIRTFLQLLAPGMLVSGQHFRRILLQNRRWT